jgi:hypothetical protein
MRRATLIAALGLAVVTPAAFAHDATVSCNPQTGQYDVVADFPQYTPTWAFTPSTVVVAWSDGYRLTLPLPAPCVAPVPPVPPVPVVPVAPPPPPVVVSPEPVKQPVTRKPPVKRAVPITCRTLKARGAGRAWYVRLGIPYALCNPPQGRPFGPARPFRGVTG